MASGPAADSANAKRRVLQKQAQQAREEELSNLQGLNNELRSELAAAKSVAELGLVLPLEARLSSIESLLQHVVDWMMLPDVPLPATPLDSIKIPRGSQLFTPVTPSTAAPTNQEEDDSLSESHGDDAASPDVRGALFAPTPTLSEASELADLADFASESADLCMPLLYDSHPAVVDAPLVLSSLSQSPDDRSCAGPVTYLQQLESVVVQPLTAAPLDVPQPVADFATVPAAAQVSTAPSLDDAIRALGTALAGFSAPSSPVPPSFGPALSDVTVPVAALPFRKDVPCTDPVFHPHMQELYGMHVQIRSLSDMQMFCMPGQIRHIASCISYEYRLVNMIQPDRRSLAVAIADGTFEQLQHILAKM